MKKVFKLSMICIISLLVLIVSVSCSENKTYVEMPQEAIGEYKEGDVTLSVTENNLVEKKGGNVVFDLNEVISKSYKKANVKVSKIGSAYYIKADYTQLCCLSLSSDSLMYVREGKTIWFDK